MIDDFSTQSHRNLSQRIRREVLAQIRTTGRQTSRALQPAREVKIENCPYHARVSMLALVYERIPKMSLHTSQTFSEEDILHQKVRNICHDEHL